MNNKGDAFLILMADSNIGDHDFVKKAARECNMNIVFTSVYNGAQLRDYVLRQGVYKIDPNVNPDLIVMDVKLEIVGTFEVLEMIKKSEKMRNIPIYFLVTNISEDDIRKAKEFGVKDFFHKPLERQDWSEVVSKICKAAAKYQRQERR